jgi:rhodanese-related sulfurtransferase
VVVKTTIEEEQRIRHLGHVALPPGLEKIFADHANRFFKEVAQADRAIFAAELNGRLAAGENLYVVDVRNQSSYQQGHIQQAINVPIEILFTDAAREPFPDDGTPVVFVCANGHTSAMAASLYGTMGYNAYSLRFGMIGWRRSTPVQVYSRAQTPQAINGVNGVIAQ